MPSNQYSGTPKVCLLCSTVEGHKPIDLLNQDGICITNPPGWIPQITKLKGGGVRIGSQSLNDDRLVAGGYEPVTETFPLAVDPVDTAARVQGLLDRLWLAEQFWLEGWQHGAVYLKVQLTEDSDIRYARIKSGAFQIGVYAFGGRSGLSNNTLVLEREPAWSPVAPGEMIGPFRNMAKNPSFERWTYDGIENQTPTGWVEQIDVNFAASHELRREDSQIAGPDHALDMTFTGAGGAAPNEWYIYQWLRLLPQQDYTFKVWLNLTMGGGAGETFFIRITDRTGAVTYLNETFTTSQNGWYYFTLTTDWEWLYYILEIGFTAPATSVGSTAIIDRILLTEGTWDADSWPGDFYITSSAIWGYQDPEAHDHSYASLQPAIDQVAIMDIDSVPGDFDALARIALEFEQIELFEYDQSVYASTSQVALFAEKAQQSDLIYMNVPGSTNWISGAIGNSCMTYTLAEDEKDVIFARQFNGDEVTQLLDHEYKLFLRLNSNKDGYFQVGYWIGDPEREVLLDQQDFLSASMVGQFIWVLATPKSTINWRKGSIERPPASVGFTVYAENTEGDGSASLYLDYAVLMPVDNGGCWSDDIWSTGQALILDTTSQSSPVQRGYINSRVTFDDTYQYSDPGFYAFAQTARVYDNRLFTFWNLGGVSQQRIFDGSEWVVMVATPSGPIEDTEIFNGQLWTVGTAGAVEYYDVNADAWTAFGSVGGTTFYYIQQFDNQLYAANSNGWVYSVIGGLAQVRNCAPQVPMCMTYYKHQLWVGCTGGTTHIYDGGGWANGTAVPCGHDLVWMIEFQDRLYAACVDGDVYSWDGQNWTLSRTGTPLVDDACYQLEVFNNELYLMTEGATVNVVTLYKTSDGSTWQNVYGINAVRTLQDGAHMEVYNGRLCTIAEATSYGQFSALWHAPLIAMLNIPDHTGTAITLPPKKRTRTHVLFEILDEGSRYDFAIAQKVWILPQWRALRDD